MLVSISPSGSFFLIDGLPCIVVAIIFFCYRIIECIFRKTEVTYNNEIIEKCNGVVKEGKEAVVYHADKGAESGGFDVAVKVFKKITEFRNRGYYVEGDPRFGKTNYRNLSSKEQLEIWTEKEFRNLTRASRAGVPVPIPLFYKDNILFMRFLGDDGWPAPQLRELELNHGSRRWSTLFSQIMDAVKLYVLIYLLNSFTLSTGKNFDTHVSSFPLLNPTGCFKEDIWFMVICPNTIY